MKKSFLLGLCAMVISVAVAQRSVSDRLPERLFKQGQAMFNDRNFAGCIDKITEYKKLAPWSDATAEADFLLAASAYHQGRNDAEWSLREFLDTYSETPHRNEIAFMLGSVYFTRQDYTLAQYWFNACDIDFLSEDEQADYAYRTGLIALEKDNLAESTRLFSLLNQYSAKYKAISSYYLGYIAYKERNYDAALEHFASVKSNSEYRSDIQYYTAQIYFAQQRYEQSIREGLALLKNYPNHANNAEIERIVGISYYQQNDYAKAVQYLKPLADADAAVLSRKDFYVLGAACYYMKKYLQAIPYLNRSNPQNDVLGQSAYLFLGQSYLQTGDTNQALRAFEPASRMDFDISAQEAALYNYAMLLHQNAISGFGEAVTALERFVNAYPRSMYADQANNALVDVYLTTKNYDTALASIAKIKQPNRKILEAKQKILYYLGTLDFTNSQYANAVEYFTKAYDAGDYALNEKQQALFWRGESYFRQADYAKATYDYQSFLKTGNAAGDLAALSSYNLGYCAFKQADYVKAKTHFQTYIHKEKSETKTLADAYSRLGDCAFDQRQFKEAENAYAESFRLQPESGDYALFQQAYVLGLQKDYQSKVNLMDKLAKDFPASLYLPDALYEKGRALVLLKRSPDAIAVYQKLMENYPERQQARSAGLQIGLLYYNDNQTDKAIASYKNVIQKYPGSDEAKEALQDLKSIYFDLNQVYSYADYVKSLGGSFQFEASEQDSLTYLAAERLFQQGKTAEAYKAFENYLKSFPQGAYTTQVHHYLANIDYEQKNYASAQQQYEKVLTAGNTQFSEEAIGRTAEIQYNNKDYKAAMESYNQLKNTATNKANREAGFLGILRSAAQINEYYAILSAANELLKEAGLNPEIENEARYYRAKAYWSLNEKQKAQSDLAVLAVDTRTVFGAESKYLLAQLAFDSHNNKEAKSIIQDYAKQTTPHQYWLARSFILLSDIFASENDKLKARQYLESLQSSYKPTNDDIHSSIKERLTKLK
ncbi:MAG: tetratricopeptide repeat protein [Candidatus Symbiothrix sp.]|jgi:TolA-binding protein|nr:tetratricopeptide repeat protein [Candidatus Symbiothrix sp.]